MIRIAIQSKGRLNEESTALLQEIGIGIDDSKRKFLSKVPNFPMEVLYLRDDDIPQVVSCGTASLGIVGENEVAEKGLDVRVVKKLGFGGCRISLAIPKDSPYEGPQWFNGKRIATSYPRILKQYLDSQGIKAEIEIITGSVEVAPAAGISDAIFDIVSSGGTLIQNGLVEVEQVFPSEAVLIANKNLEEEKLAELAKLKFRFSSIFDSRGMKYVLMNIPQDRIPAAVALLPGMKSPTLMPLSEDGWYSMHVVIPQDELWEKIERLKELGAEDILVLALENMIR